MAIAVFHYLYVLLKYWMNALNRKTNHLVMSNHIQ